MLRRRIAVYHNNVSTESPPTATIKTQFALNILQVFTI